ncbi:MAG: alpha/beta fold hydrolase [Polaromonas sp.]|nr:alpha/beta fold hydrolase [Polaromonas sp.]
MNYDAPWWLPGGNLQTIWAALHSQRYLGPPPVFRRERWATPDGDFVDVDYVDMAPTLPTSCGSLPPEGAGLARGGPSLRPLAATLPTACGSLPPEGAHFSSGRPFGKTVASTLVASHTALRPQAAFPDRPEPVEGQTRGGTPACLERSASAQRAATLPGADAGCRQPLLIVFHGLEGSSASHYAEAFAAVAQSRGWACAVPHFRGCSGEINLAARAYHSGDFEEIDWMLRRFRQTCAGPLLAVGISLGGNALMRWAAESGAAGRAVVSAVASVCSPLDLAASGAAIGRGFNRLVYTGMFLRSMKPKALQKLAQHPGLFDLGRLLAARTLYDFDNVFTAPLHGFKDTDDYWTRASAKPHLHRIALPALALNARNDPFVPVASLPGAADASRHLTLWQPAEGGHVGFPSGPFPGHVRAMPEAVVAFLAAQL